MPTQRVCIVEDDEEYARAIQSALEKYSKESGERFKVTRMSSATEFMDEQRSFDLILMDIGLPGITGMEAAEWLRTFDESVQLVFITNLAQYAAHGYAVGALDFIVKPIRYMDFKLTLDRALRQIARQEQHSLALSTKDGMRIISTADLSYVDVLDHTLAYHLIDGGDIRVRGKLYDLEQELSQSTFVRISKSCLVNMRHIRQIKGPELSLSDGQTVFISRGMRKAALMAITNYFGGNS